MTRIVILSGAGMSAESGLKTFRDADGLWEGHDVMDVASPEGWARDPALVLDFYNKRRKQLLDAQPNEGHLALARLEDKYEVDIVTQNVDDLHERAGSRRVLHLHGELLKVRSSVDENEIYVWHKDVRIGHVCSKGSQLRPHVVWFGEAVRAIEPAAEIVARADKVLIIGTSMQVYPAAGLVHYAQRSTEVIYVDPRPNVSFDLIRLLNLRVIPRPAASGVPELVEELLQG